MKDQHDQERQDAHGEAREFRGELFEGLSFGGVGLACAGARVLVPGQLDGELSEAQGNELRAHLLDCGACREVLKQETHLRCWFREGLPQPVPVPAGFAQRVARRAYQGDPGIDFSEREDYSSRVSTHGARPKRGALLSFLLVSTTVAAAALFLFAVALQKETLPEGRELKAGDYTPPWERAATQSLFPESISPEGSPLVFESEETSGTLTPEGDPAAGKGE